MTPTTPIRSCVSLLLFKSLIRILFRLFLLQQFLKRKCLTPVSSIFTGGSIPLRSTRRRALFCSNTWGTYTAMRQKIPGSPVGLAPGRVSGLQLKVQDSLTHPVRLQASISRRNLPMKLNSPGEFERPYYCSARHGQFLFWFKYRGSQIFSDPLNRFAPVTIALPSSLRDPASQHRRVLLNKDLFLSREFKKGTFPWSFISSASSLSARLAIFSAALADLYYELVLEVTEEVIVTIRALFLECRRCSFRGLLAYGCLR